MHQESTVAFIKDVQEAMEITCESQENNNKEIMTASLVSENGEVTDMNISVITKYIWFCSLMNCQWEFQRKES